jgi:hypothetical protein
MKLLSIQFTSSLLDPHTFFSTLHSNTLSLHLEQVSHPKTTKLGDKIFWTEWKLAVTRLNVLFISSWTTFWFHCILYDLNFVTFSKNLLAMAMCDFVLHDTWIYTKVASTQSVLLHNITALN